jgi:hypothetical protein
MIRLVTYSDQNMTISRERCIKSFADRYVMQDLSIHEWDRAMIEQTEFYQLNREILDQERGSGYWCWKPYIIYKALLDMTENDVLIYSDAGVEFINDVSHIINVMDEDLFLFGNNWNHLHWTKMDVIEYINGYYDTPNETGRFNNLKQVQASVIFIRPTQYAKRFIKEWMLLCQVPGLIDDSPSIAKNHPEFRDTRHDQSCLTSLAYEYGISKHWWPSSYSNGAFIYEKIEQYKNDNYPVMFNHTRKRNHEW